MRSAAEALCLEGIKSDCETRKRIRWVLGVRFFEEFDSKYGKFLEEAKKKRN